MVIEGNTRIEGLLELEEFTHEQLIARALISEWGALGRCGDHDQIEMVRRNGTLSGVVTFTDHWDAYDAVVDSAFSTTDPDAFGSIQAAIDVDKVSIFVNKSTEPGDFTIASSDNVQRIVGKDADTTVIPVDITCDKADVTFENLRFEDSNLTINGNGCTVRNCLFTGTAVLTIDSNNNLVEGNRFVTLSVIPLVIVEGNNRIQRNRFSAVTAANYISLDSDGSDLSNLVISDNFFDIGTSLTDYALQSQGTTGTDEIINCIIVGNVFANFPKGGIDIFGHDNLIIANQFISSATMPTSDRCIQLNSSGAIDTIVLGNSFNTLSTTNRVIEYTGADGDAEGLAFVSNTIGRNGGHILCSQDMQLAQDKAATNVTVNFQSKPGIVVLGGDMTSATLSNIPADVVFRNVKGQDDRGDYLPVDGAVDLGSDTKRFAELWLSGNADIEGNLQLDGNLTLGGTVTSDLVPTTDDTHDLGAIGAQWKDLFVDGTANIDNANIGTLSSTMLPASDSVYILGETERRWINLYLDALDVQGNIVVGGTVDGEDIAALGAASHVEAHTAASHSDQGATGAELETLTSAGDASALHGHGSYTDEVFLQPVFHVNAAQSNTGDIAFVEIDDTQKMHFTWMLPDTWVSTTLVELIMYPNTTETIAVDFSISSLAVGETAGANQAVNNNQALAVIADQVTEWGIGAFVPTGSAGDVLMVRLDSDTADIRVLGLKIVFVRN